MEAQPGVRVECALGLKLTLHITEDKDTLFAFPLSLTDCCWCAEFPPIAGCCIQRHKASVTADACTQGNACLQPKTKQSHHVNGIGSLKDWLLVDM